MSILICPFPIYPDRYVHFIAMDISEIDMSISIFRYIHSYKMDISIWIYRKSICPYRISAIHSYKMDISIWIYRKSISKMTSSNVSISDMSISIYRISDIPVFLPAPLFYCHGRMKLFTMPF